MTARNQLSGERVRLAAIRDADIDEIISWDDDEEFLRNLSSGPAYPRPESVQRGWWQERLKNKNEYHFAIRLNEDDRIIGTFHIVDLDWANQAAWFSIGLGATGIRGQGFGAEAMKLGLDFVFNSLNLHRLALGVFADNEPAIRLYKRLGFTHEGTQREYLNRNGQRIDIELYAMLAWEWRARA